MSQPEATQYFIKGGYKHKGRNTTLDHNRPLDYWHSQKTDMSRYYQRAVYAHAAALIQKKKLLSVLDVGCGPAYKLMEIVRPVCPDVMGVDQKSVIAFAQKTFGEQFFFADDFENPLYPMNRAFDLVMCVDVVEHMYNPDQLLTYLKHYVRKGGYVIISTPERDVLRGVDNTESPNPGHVREWNTQELSTYVRSQGLSIVSTTLLPALSFHLSRFYFRERLAHFGRHNHCLTIVAQVHETEA